MMAKSSAPRTLIVSQNRRGEYRQIQKAIAAAEPGDTVLVEPGEYNEDLKLRSGITLRGVTRDQTRVIAAKSNALLAAGVDAAIVLNLIFEGANKAESAAVLIDSSTLTLENCTICGAAHAGVEARQAHVTLRRCLLRNNRQTGFFLHTDSTGMLEENTFLENGLHGLEAAERSHLTAKANTIEKNDNCGLIAQSSCECILSGNTVTGNGRHGVHVAGQSRLEAQDNRIDHNGLSGLAVTQESAAFLSNNQITANRGPGVELQSQSRLNAQHNIIRENKQSGVFINEGSEAAITKDVIVDNRLHGIVVDRRSVAKLDSNTIVGNGECGVWALAEARVKLRHTIIAHHGRAGVQTSGYAAAPPAAEIALSRNCFWQNKPDYHAGIGGRTSFVANPLFVDLKKSDYRLSAKSPCLGAGLQNEDLGALPFEGDRAAAGAGLPADFKIIMHLQTWPLSHVASASAGAAVQWLRGAGATGRSLPFFLVHDLGMLCASASLRKAIARPEYLPEEMNTSAYSSFLKRLAGHPAVREVGTWHLSDAVISAILTRLLAGISFSQHYALPPGEEAPSFAAKLLAEIKQTEPRRIWLETDPADRPGLAHLLPAQALAQIEANLHRLGLDELRFLHQYGPRFTSEPDARELLDLFHFVDLPAEARAVMSQVLQLLPVVSQALHAAGAQTYAAGGYAGLTRKGSQDSLVPSELAYPREMFAHRLVNQEALYYGREGERERRRALACVVTQAGLEMLGDAEVLARALTLALAQTLQRRGYEVWQGFAGSRWLPPGHMNAPSDFYRILYFRDRACVQAAACLQGMYEQLRAWRERYSSITVFWVLGEHWDAEDWQSHAGLYRMLLLYASQRAWFICMGPGLQQHNGRVPAVAKQFHSFQTLNTEMLWRNREKKFRNF